MLKNLYSRKLLQDFFVSKQIVFSLKSLLKKVEIVQVQNIWSFFLYLFCFSRLKLLKAVKRNYYYCLSSSLIRVWSTRIFLLSLQKPFIKKTAIFKMDWFISFSKIFWNNLKSVTNITAQKMKFFITDWFSFLRIWSNLLKKSAMKNFSFFAMYSIVTNV